MSARSAGSSGTVGMTGRKADPTNNFRSYSTSSRNTTSTRAGAQSAQRDVRSLPPWIDSYEAGDEPPRPATTDRLLPSPQKSYQAQHHYATSQPARRVSQDGFIDAYDESLPEKRQDNTGFFGGHREPVRGRKWDHAREGDPVIMQSSMVQSSSPWQTYIRATKYGHSQSEDSKRMNEEFLREQTPGYEKPWRGDVEDGDDPDNISGLFRSKKKRRTFIKRLQNKLLTHPLVPLVFRLVVLATSTIALALSASVHHLSNKYHYDQNASTTMSLVVDVVSIPYLLYITWDEYTGKPLGLRSPKAKIRLVLLDLWFIIFESANLALAFGAQVDDNGSCKSEGSGANYVICDRVKALVGILLIALIAWSLTFSISIFRVVERVGGREEQD